MTLPPDSAGAERTQDARGRGPSATATVAPIGHPSPAGSGGCPERPRISKDQRDALYDLILSRLVAIDDLWRMIEAENYEAAERLAREYSDSLSLILDGLGWGADGEAVELRMPAEGLRRVFGLLHARTTRSLVIEQKEEAEARAVREDSQLVLSACKEVFTTLDMQDMGENRERQTERQWWGARKSPGGSDSRGGS